MLNGGLKLLYVAPDTSAWAFAVQESLYPLMDVFNGFDESNLTKAQVPTIAI